MKKSLLILLVNLIFLSNGFAANRVINLVVGYKTVSFAGRYVKAIAVNNQIPAPTLHFKEGDRVTINVCNRLKEETTIHWHGILVPWQMDGVLGVSQKGIPPGGVFTYQFTLHQAGTYWYHSHSGLQEQAGLYGAFIVEPRHTPSYHYTKDFAIVLSDWSNTKPDRIFLNLKKSGDYYAPNFPLQPSLAHYIHDDQCASCAERRMLQDDYKMMQQMRMSIYDINDVAYDALLLNGQPNCCPWTASVKVGDIVRLRFIGASSETIFHVKIPNSMMQMVHVQGNDVVPYQIEDFRIAPGETYDVLVKIKKNEPYIIYAEAADKIGAAYGALLTSSCQYVNCNDVQPFLEPLPTTREMMSFGMHGHSMQMNHSHPEVSPSPHSEHHAMPMEHSMKMDGDASHQDAPPTPHAEHHDMPMEHSMKMDGDAKHRDVPPTPQVEHHAMSMSHAMTMKPSEQNVMLTKYKNLKAAVKTNDPDKPICETIHLELNGWMDRFIWFINGVPEYNAKPIIFEPGKRYRLIFTNNSMMHHPMHIHGHWFILRKGLGSYDPLLHTIDVPPGATITADVDADASGQWFFHCHMLYHMMAGMARVYQYSTLIEITKCEIKPQYIIKNTAYVNRPIVRVDEVKPIDVSLVHHPMAHSAGFYFSTLLDVGTDPFHNTQELTYKGLYGPDYNKLELFTNDAEITKGTVDNADIDIFYWHLIDQFWALKGGVNYFYRPAAAPYWQPGIGIEGLMPYFIETDVRGYYYGGSAKLDVELSRDTQLTNNLLFTLGIRGVMATKTITSAAIGTGLNQTWFTLRPYYRLMPGLNVFVEYEHQQDYGDFKQIQTAAGESTSDDTLTFGFSLLF